MERFINGWEECGHDYLMYHKKEKERIHSFVERVWLDRTGEDIRNGVKEYAICSATIDLHDYTREEIETYLPTYGYDNIRKMEDKYGLPYEYLDDRIAEMIFDIDCLYDNYSWNGTYSEEESEIAIRKYLEEN